ncbi:hypothetical protein [Pseudoflavonifractor phocaeensis]|uniref:hypothetical protein n=1 Tax=Pseudoflavonifractor phocaeensis TaxID=1870988 RepID=UPI001F2C7CA2|nr:hypothetical protein [Pseudoflavonifractor phocaeensis]MCF2661183.1 hypothetical protein [Pseudoflavonifractor phocaeensis]
MLMKTNETSYFTFAVAVAVNCSAVDLSANASPDQAAAYVEDILSVIFSNTDVTASVEPMAYPVTSKIPLIITLNDSVQRLLWFYPQMSACELAAELEGLFSDVSMGMLSATA